MDVNASIVRPPAGSAVQPLLSVRVTCIDIFCLTDGTGMLRYENTWDHAQLLENTWWRTEPIILTHLVKRQMTLAS